MRATLRFLFTLVLGSATALSASAQQAVRWQPDLDSARRLAAQTNRLILIHFWAEGCEPCARMDRDVFSRFDVAAALETDYVPVRVNVRHYPATAQQFGITSWPTDVVVTVHGNVLDKSIGFKPASAYLGRLKQLAMTARGPVTPRVGTPQSAERRLAGTTQPMGQPSLPYNPSGTTPPTTAARADTHPLAGMTSPSTDPNMPPPSWQVQPTYTNRAGQSSTPQPTRSSDRWGGGPVAGGTLPNTPAAANLSSAPSAYGYGRGKDDPLTSVGQVGTGPGLASSTSMAGTAGKPQPAAGNPPLALDGYCAVSLAEKERWVKGNPRFGVIHEGRTYLFAGPDEARRFYEEPERFAPAMSGNDVVLLADRGQTVAGRREHGAWYGGRVYLFASEDSYAKFAQDPKRYVSPTVQPAASTARCSDSPIGTNDQGVVPPNGGGPAWRSAVPWEAGPEASAPAPSTPYPGGSQPNARHSAPSWRS